MTVAEGEWVPIPRVLAWIFLLGYVLVIAIARSLYAASGAAPSAPFELLSMVGFMTFVWNWVVQECERYGATLPMDAAWFLALLWFVLPPYYMWRSQGWKGLLKCAVVCAWSLGAWAVGLAVFYAVAER